MCCFGVFVWLNMYILFFTSTTSCLLSRVYLKSTIATNDDSITNIPWFLSTVCYRIIHHFRVCILVRNHVHYVHKCLPNYYIFFRSFDKLQTYVYYNFRYGHIIYISMQRVHLCAQFYLQITGTAHPIFEHYAIRMCVGIISEQTKCDERKNAHARKPHRDTLLVT